MTLCSPGRGMCPGEEGFDVYSVGSRQDSVEGWQSWGHPAPGSAGSHQVERLLLVPRVPTPGGARLSSVPLELLMEGRGFFVFFFFSPAVPSLGGAGGGTGAAGWVTLPW